MSDVIFVSHDVMIHTHLIATEMLNSFGFFIHNLSLITCAFYICGKIPKKEKKNSHSEKKLFLSMSLSFSKWWKCSESVAKSLGKVKTNV